MKRYEARFHYINEMGAGAHLAKAVLVKLAKEGHFVSCVRFAMNCAARLLGNRMGRWAEERAQKA